MSLNDNYRLKCELVSSLFNLLLLDGLCFIYVWFLRLPTTSHHHKHNQIIVSFCYESNLVFLHS